MTPTRHAAVQIRALLAGCPPADRCRCGVRRRLRLRPAHPGPGRGTRRGAGAAALRPLLLRRPATTARPGSTGRPRRHGAKFNCADPTTWPAPTATLVVVDDQYGTVTVTAWAGLHPKQQRHPGHGSREPRPIVRGTIIRVQVDRVPARTRPPKVLWLWWSGSGRARPGPRLAGLYPPLRPGAHHPVRQADPRLDDPASPPARAGRPLDLAGAGRLHPAAPGPPDRRRPRLPWERPRPQPRLSPLRVRRGFPRFSLRSARRPPRRNPPVAPQAGPRAGPRGPRPATRRSRSLPRSQGASRPRRRRPPDRPSPPRARRPRSPASPARPRVKSQAKRPYQNGQVGLVI